mmetsp:Transcript_75314/g.189477  ORF Transcript_75314/g.189477 Transcript_75314/m.189477 type:complete len:201 (+) Transcript_75314:80-682(+)
MHDVHSLRVQGWGSQPLHPGVLVDALVLEAIIWALTHEFQDQILRLLVLERLHAVLPGALHVLAALPAVVEVDARIHGAAIAHGRHSLKPSRQEHPEEDPEGVEVHAVVVRALTQDLWGEIPCAPHWMSERPLPVAHDAASSEAEVSEFGDVVLAEDDVLGLQIPQQRADLPMQVIQAKEDMRQPQRSLRRVAVLTKTTT